MTSMALRRALGIARGMKYNQYAIDNIETQIEIAASLLKRAAETIARQERLLDELQRQTSVLDDRPMIDVTRTGEL